MAAIPSREVTTKMITGLSFGFYTDEEIRNISVKSITSPITFDNLKQPVPDGLYDSSMGPIDLRGTCATCKLNHHQCPGHFGHIELAVPVYHPLVFSDLHKLLRCVCLRCFKLKMQDELVELYCKRMELLKKGNLVDALAFRLGLDKGLVVDDADDESGSDDDDQEIGGSAGRLLEQASGLKKQGTTGVTAQVRAAIQKTATEFLQKMPKSKCRNCECISPVIKKEGFCKLFKMPMADKSKEANLASASGGDKKGKKGQKKAASKGKDREEDEEGDGDDDEEDHDDEEEEKDDEDGSGSDGDEGKRRQQEDDGEIEASWGDVLQDTEGSSGRPVFMTVSEVQSIMKRAWSKNIKSLSLMYDAQSSTGDASKAEDTDGYRRFFLQTVPVAPNRFRPINVAGGMVFDHAQNVMLTKCINANLDIAEMYNIAEEEQATGPAFDMARVVRLWLDLQNSVNTLIDSSTAEKDSSAAPTVGIRQGLERKEGLFRKNMMGKRVNFAARSVISPDPCIGAGEIGVPPYFAKRLSFPEKVTTWNVAELRNLIERGPDNYPGAVAVEDERGIMVFLGKLSAQRRAALAKTLLSGSGKGGSKTGDLGKGKTVYRQLMDGDLMLTNRQPTLHKPGLMAHRARVLRGERTIRMHYANCATFNADFDGDEINLHLPQDHLARAEGYHIMHADHQFNVPTDGKPIRGLIQDHIISAVLITKRDTFFTRAQYQQLIYAAFSGPATARGMALMSLQPALCKPRVLWTGKQLISTVLLNWTRRLPPLTLRAGTKTPAEYFGKESNESEANFFKGELVAGILDKAAFGKHGLLHGIQELYGDTMAGNVLSSLSRLFTHFTQINGFTCGIDDVLLKGVAEGERAAVVALAEQTALKASADMVKMDELPPGPGGAAAVQSALSKAYRTNSSTGAMHDMKVSGNMHPLSSKVVKACLPSGQVKRFPGNCMSLMTTTGAKGSLVNFSQISCLLGQQELEGRRTPRMNSGKTLPCFVRYDGGARPGGFIGDRFLSGLRPQEFYFHCMAGRDGLVDTTVKTSRSGYLQRCLVKNLEALRVHYDGSVRDDTDGSVVQLAYGEDGLDMLQTSYINEFNFMAENADRYAQQLNIAEAADVGMNVARIDESKVAEAAEAGTNEGRRAARKGPHEPGAASGVKPPSGLGASNAPYWCSSGVCQTAAQPSVLPVMAEIPPTYMGSTSEKFADKLDSFIQSMGGGTLRASDPKKLKKEKKKGAKKGKSSVEEDGAAARPDTPSQFLKLMQLKYMRCLMQPGEAVGVLAAQSIGEPSTQMTLNTFHMAGRGEANVTMGIPRVREILMTAAKSIKTPVMVLPVVKGGKAEKNVQELASRLRRIRLAELMQSFKVLEYPVAAQGGDLARAYVIEMTFVDPKRYPADAAVTFQQIEDTIQESFVKSMNLAIKAALRKAGKTSIGVESEYKESASGKGGKAGAAAAEEAPGGVEADDDDADDEENENQDGEEYEEGKLRWRSGRNELATYEDDDDSSGSDDDEEKPAGAVAPVEASKPATKSKKGGEKDEQLQVESASRAKDCKGSVTIRVPLDAPKLMMLDIAERVAARTFVRATPGIEKCYMIGADQPAGPAVQTDGINFIGAFQQADLVDINRITCNCVTSMLTTFGVEAARATIVQEVRAVFGAYGIGVDMRHLSLIADYMTQGGGYRAMSRAGISSCTSPLLKMSFETAAKFLTAATLEGDLDDLRSPSSRIIVGRVMGMGTGCMDLMHNLS